MTARRNSDPVHQQAAYRPRPGVVIPLPALGQSDTRAPLHTTLRIRGIVSGLAQYPAAPEHLVMCASIRRPSRRANRVYSRSGRPPTQETEPSRSRRVTAATPRRTGSGFGHNCRRSQAPLRLPGAITSKVTGCERIVGRQPASSAVGVSPSVAAKSALVPFPASPAR